MIKTNKDEKHQWVLYVTTRFVFPFSLASHFFVMGGSTQRNAIPVTRQKHGEDKANNR